MKFIHVTDLAYPHIGGVEYVVMKYSSMQTKEGHRAIVITSKLPGTRKNESIEKVRYIRLPKSGMITKTPFFIKKEKPSLVHTHSYLSAVSLSFLWKVHRKIPILRHIHDVYIGKLEEYTGWEGSKLYEKLEKYLISLDYTGYITPSNYTKKRLIEIGLDKDRIHVVHPGVDLHKFGKSDGTYARKKHKIPENKKIIGFVGRLSTGKGPQFLIEAAKDLDAYIILIGPNPDPKTSGIVGIENELREMAKKYNIEKRVIFAGKVKDWELPLYYDSFDIFCLPSLSEGFGMSIAEALASGKPVVSFRTTAIPEIVKHGYNGLLAEPKNIKDLRKKLEALLTDDSLYNRLSKNTRKSVEQFSWENSYKTLMRVYSKYL